MKRILGMLATLLAGSLIFTAFPAFAANYSVKVVVNGQTVQFPDAQPFIDNHQRIQLPLRFITEALGAKVLWDQAAQKASISLADRKMNVYVGKMSYEINGATKRMDTSPVVKQSRTYVPLRFVYEGLGVATKWDSAVKTVYITAGGESSPDGTYTATVHGFSIPYKHNGPNLYPTYITDARLRVTEYENKGKNSMLFELSIEYDEKGSDPVQAAQEAEAILRQKIESGVVDAVMKYVRTKSKASDELEYKLFTARNYKIDVTSQAGSRIGIGVFLK